MNEPNFYRQLVKRYRNGNASPEEVTLFLHFLKEGILEEYLLEDISGVLEVEHSSSVKTEKERPRRWFYYTAAAVIVVFLLSAYVITKINNNLDYVQIVEQNDALPAEDKAVLILKNGRSIFLDSVKEGIIAQENGIWITKSKNGEIQYRGSASESFGNTIYNEIRIPKGGKYQVILIDGTKVSLNAGSTLRYPYLFTDEKRQVFLSGEGYFDVAKEKLRPFIVSSKDQYIEVLGTQFNVKAYPNDKTITTLIEGSIALQETKKSKSHLLKPGQQAFLTDKGLQINQADIEHALAWKNNVFIFRNTSLSSIMKDLSRWYNVEVDTDELPDLQFNGYIPRNVPLSKVLHMLQLTGDVNFKIANRKIKITNGK